MLWSTIRELRSLIPDGTPILALTATAAKKTREEIRKALNLRTDYQGEGK